LTRTILPSPGIVKEFLAFLYASATRASRVCTACFLVRPTVYASDATICDLDNAFAIFVFGGIVAEPNETKGKVEGPALFTSTS